MTMTYLLIRVRHCQFQRGRPGICKFGVKHKLSKYSDRLYVFIKQFQFFSCKRNSSPLFKCEVV